MKKTRFNKKGVEVVAADKKNTGTYEDREGKETARLINMSNQLARPVSVSALQAGKVPDYIDNDNFYTLGFGNSKQVQEEKMARAAEIANTSDDMAVWELMALKSARQGAAQK